MNMIMNSPKVILLALVLIAALLSCNSEAKQEADNKAVVRKALEAMNKFDYESLKKTLADNYQRHSQATPGVTISNPDEFIAMLKVWFSAFPDAVQKIKMLTAEGDMVAFNITFEGTHLGPMNGIPATGKRVFSDAFGFHRMENGKIAETWVTWDNLAMFNQLGVSPPSTK